MTARSAMMPDMERVLVTGAAGRIGRMLRSRMRRDGRVLRLLDIAPVEEEGGDPGSRRCARAWPTSVR